MLVELHNATSFAKRTKRRRRRTTTIRQTRDGVISLTGGYSLAIRRNSGHAGTNAMAAAVEAGFSRQAINRWETLLGANAIAQSRAFYRSNYEYLEAVHANPPPPPQPDGDDAYNYTWEIHSIAGDGTNVPIHFSGKRDSKDDATTTVPVVFSDKAHTCRVQSIFCHLDDCDVGDVEAPLQTYQSAWADLQRIPQSNTGATQRALYLKQVSSLGVLPWTDEMSVFSLFGYDDGVGPVGSYFHCRIYVFAADQGPDQVASHDLISAEVVGRLNVIVIRSYCLRHILNLINKKAIQRFESRRTVNNTSMIANTWRAGSNAKQIYETTRELYGAEVAADICGRLIPRPLTTRWGYLNRVDKYLLNFGEERLRRVWTLALLQKASARLTEANQVLDSSRKRNNVITIDAGESRDAFILKESKWIQGSFNAILSHAYWTEVEIGFLVRAPVVHTEHWIEKATREKRSVITELVCGKSLRIYGEWEEQLKTAAGFNFLFDVNQSLRSER